MNTKLHAEILEAFCNSYTERTDVDVSVRYAELSGALHNMMELSMVHGATPDQVAHLMVESMERRLAPV